MFDTMQHKSSGSKILEEYIAASPDKAARSVEDMALSEAVFWFSGLRASSIIICLEHMSAKKAAFLLRRLHIKQAARIMQGLSARRAGEIMLNLPPHYKRRLADSLEQGQLKAMQEVLNYPKASAARVMKNDFLSFKTDAKVKDIIARLKTLPSNKIPLSVFILDKGGKLCGVIATGQLAFYTQDSLAGSVMNGFIKLSPFDDVAKARDLLMKNKLSLLPVTDADNTLLGVVSVWDLSKAESAQPAREKSDQNIKSGGGRFVPLIAALLFVLAVIISFIIFQI